MRISDWSSDVCSSDLFVIIFQTDAKAPVWKNFSDHAFHEKEVFLCHQADCRLTAEVFPRRSVSSSKLTRWSLSRVRIPARSTAVMCTKASGEPSSGAMKP